VTGFQRLPHHRDITGAVERISAPPIWSAPDFVMSNKVRDQVFAEVLGVDEVGHAEAFAPRLAVVVDVDPDDHVGACERRPCSTLSPMPPRPKTIALAPCSTFAVLMTAPTPW